MRRRSACEPFRAAGHVPFKDGTNTVTFTFSRLVPSFGWSLRPVGTGPHTRATCCVRGYGPGDDLSSWIPTEQVGAMRTTFHAKLDELLTDVARMAQRAGRMLTNSSIALHQNDLTLAGLVLTDRDRMNSIHDDIERRCITLLALQAPVAGDLRVVVAAMRALDHVKRMACLARHTAVMARHKQPNPMLLGEVRPVLARMSLLASQLAEDAATALEHQDPLSGCRLAVADDEVDALLRHLLSILFAEGWPHGVEQAVDAALLGRYYERFGDHGVAIAQQVCYLATGGVAAPDTVGMASGPARS